MKNMDEALAKAIRNKDTDKVEQLVAKGVDLNVIKVRFQHQIVRDYPLHIAIREGATAIVQYLINSGADHEKADNSGNTPLVTATFCDQFSAAIMLLAAGANVNATGPSGHAPLDTAVLNRCNPNLVVALLEHGADINQVTRKKAAIHTAAALTPEKDADAMVRLLHHHGADMLTASWEGMPFEVAQKAGNLRVAKQLLNYANAQARGQAPATCFEKMADAINPPPVLPASL